MCVGLSLGFLCCTIDLLIYISGFVLVPRCLDYCIFVVWSEVREPDSSSSVFLSSKSFIVSGLTFRSLIHFEFVFVYGVREYSNFILLHVAVQISQLHLLKRLSFLHSMFLPPLL